MCNYSCGAEHWLSRRNMLFLHRHLYALLLVIRESSANNDRQVKLCPALSRGAVVVGVVFPERPAPVRSQFSAIYPTHNATEKSYARHRHVEPLVRARS